MSSLLFLASALCALRGAITAGWVLLIIGGVVMILEVLA